MDARLLEHVRAHHEIGVPVAAGIRAVGADAAHLRSEVEDALGSGLLEHPGRLLHARQVVVGASRNDDVVALFLEALDEVGAEEAPAAGDEHAHRGSVPSAPAANRLRSPA